jgi:hypothetical protein
MRRFWHRDSLLDAGETIPARVKEAENQTTAERTTFDAEVRRE